MAGETPFADLDAIESYLRAEFEVEWAGALVRMFAGADDFWPGQGTDFRAGAADLRRLIEANR